MCVRARERAWGRTRVSTSTTLWHSYGGRSFGFRYFPLPSLSRLFLFDSFSFLSFFHCNGIVASARYTSLSSEPNHLLAIRQKYETAAGMLYALGEKGQCQGEPGVVIFPFCPFSGHCVLEARENQRVR